MIHYISKLGMKFFRFIIFSSIYKCLLWEYPRLLRGKESANAGDGGSTPAWRISPGVGNGSPFQYSRLGNPTDRGAWWATVHGLPRLRHDGATEHTHIRVSRKFRDISFCLFAYLLDAWGTLIERLRMKKVMFFI